MRRTLLLVPFCACFDFSTASRCFRSDAAECRLTEDDGPTIPTCRDPLAQPFAPGSIWNLPLGASASYVDAGIAKASAWGMDLEASVIVLTPDAPPTPVYRSDAGWSGSSRCKPESEILFEAPIPAALVVPDATAKRQPDLPSAILDADGNTLYQGQPMGRCEPGGPVTLQYFQANETLTGMGISGANSGSGLSSLGGTIRLGELVPDGEIRHAMRVGLFGEENYFFDETTEGFRWPADNATAGASSIYGGTNPALRLGALLALPASTDLDSLGLETEAAWILARAFQDFGAYVVDDTGWSVYTIATELGPEGRVEDEFEKQWGFSMTPQSRDTPWARDMDRLFLNLAVVDNWGEADWNDVSASEGELGVGGGVPRVPWAQGLCP